MSFLKYDYLGDDVIKGFDKYKYSSQDTSPFSKYVMHPFWNWLVEYVPRTVAPNLMTLVGFLCLVANGALLIAFDPQLYASSIDRPDYPPVPGWLWIVCAVLNFASHTLDGMDGKQARRTGTSSPVGELFDHGLDSWATLFFPMCIYSVFGRGQFGGDTLRVYYVFVIVMGQFVLSHWEKYVTGMLFLPWAYDLSQVGLSAVYLVTFFAGAGFWQGHAATGWTYADVTLLCVYLGFWVLCVPLTLYNLLESYWKGTSRQRSLLAALKPLLSPAILFAASTAWAHASPNAIIEASPRLFFAAFGTVFSNIACRLIVSQMSSTTCEAVNLMTAGYAAAAAAALTLAPGPQQEFVLLAVTTAAAVALHLHYGFNVVNQMLDHFNLRAFVIPTKAK